jgi:hypothetical protein
VVVAPPCDGWTAPRLDVERDRHARGGVVVHPPEHRQVVVLDAADDGDDETALGGLASQLVSMRGSWMACTTPGPRAEERC